MMNRRKHKHGANLVQKVKEYTSTVVPLKMPTIVGGAGGNNIDAIKRYFTDKNVIQSISNGVGIPYDELIGGHYKLLLEPIAYFTFKGVKWAMGRLGVSLGFDGSTTQLLQKVILGAVTEDVLTIIFLLIFAIAVFVLWIRLIGRGFEILVLRIGVPFASLGLLDSDMGAFKGYMTDQEITYLCKVFADLTTYQDSSDEIYEDIPLLPQKKRFLTTRSAESGDSAALRNLLTPVGGISFGVSKVIIGPVVGRIYGAMKALYYLAHEEDLQRFDTLLNELDVLATAIPIEKVPSLTAFVMDARNTLVLILIITGGLLLTNARLPHFSIRGKAKELAARVEAASQKKKKHKETAREYVERIDGHPHGASGNDLINRPFCGSRKCKHI